MMLHSYIGNSLTCAIMYLLSKNEFNFRSECYVNHLISKPTGCVYSWLRLQRKILFSFYVDIAWVSLHFPKSFPLTVLEGEKSLVCAKRYMKLCSRIRIKRFANNIKRCADDSLLTRCRYCVLRRTKQSQLCHSNTSRSESDLIVMGLCCLPPFSWLRHDFLTSSYTCFDALIRKSHVKYLKSIKKSGINIDKICLFLHTSAPRAIRFFAVSWIRRSLLTGFPQKMIDG